MRILVAGLVIVLSSLAVAGDNPKPPETQVAEVPPRCTDLGSPTPFMVERLYGPPISREDTLCNEGPIPYGKTFVDWRCLIWHYQDRQSIRFMRSSDVWNARRPTYASAAEAETLVRNSTAMVVDCSIVPGKDDTRDRMVVMCLVGMEQTRCSDVFPKLAKAVHCADEAEAARYVARNCPGPGQ